MLNAKHMVNDKELVIIVSNALNKLNEVCIFSLQLPLRVFLGHYEDQSDSPHFIFQKTDSQEWYNQSPETEMPQLLEMVAFLSVSFSQ